ncbi:MAG: LamG-like jellyroll fold domain-containing protein [Verrucomicrobiia bacterium]
MTPNDPRLDWMRQYAEGTASAETTAQLQQALRDDPEFRSLFLEYLNLDLALSANAVLPAPGSETVVRVPQSRWQLWRLVATAAAACVALIFALSWWHAERPPFATVASGVGAGSLANGAQVCGEVHEIKEGLLDMITARGARIVIEAPATFRFESAQRLRMMHGRISADVPPSAKGFTVITPTGRAVDLGTKFGVDVPLHGEAEIHVFQGKVIAQSAGGGKRRSLRDGEAFALQSGAGVTRELRSAAFVRHEEVASLHAALTAGQQARSAAALAAMRRDPALIALLDFESPDLPPGHYRIVQGRWPGSRAPEFVNVADRMKLDAGGDREWPQLTLAAWVRLDRLGAPYQSLLHTDGWSKNKPGQVHWMLTHSTTMRLALFGNTLAPGSDERHGFPDSLTPVLSEQGRWVHLAVVYDSEKRTARFYLNGRFDKETRQEIAHPARLGPAQIGNWDQHDRKLSGRMDELILLGRAMSDGEVLALFDAGNPYY